MRRFIFCFFLVIFFSSCHKQRQGEPAPDTATSGAFELVADETLKPCIDSLVFGFNSQTPNAKVTVRYKNATEALDDLLQGRARLVLIGRPLSKKERDVLSKQKIELTEAEVAVNAIGCVVGRHSNLDMISMDSLNRLINGEALGKYGNWGLISSSYLSSTEVILDSIFGRENYVEGMIAEYQTTDSIINRVKKLENAIGFVNASWIKKLSSSGDSSIKVLLITGISDRPIMMHPAYILQKLYPLTSRIMAYTTEVPNTLPRGFLAYAMSADGQRVFLNFDLLPATQILKLVPPQ